MNRFFQYLMVASCISAGMFIAGGCSKKMAKVEPAIEAATTPVPSALPPPPAPAPFDSTAIIEALLRDALQNIYFDIDRYNLRQDAIDRLGGIGKILFDRPSLSLRIEGHCDDRGSSDYNMGLGELRANAAKKWLVTYGISDSRLQVTSYGRERPAAYNCAVESCHQQNRRCEFKVIGL